MKCGMLVTEFYVRKISDKSEERDVSYKKHYTPAGVKLVDALKKYLDELPEQSKDSGKPLYGTAAYTYLSRDGRYITDLSAACSASLRSYAPKDLLYIVHRAYNLEHKHLGLTEDIVNDYYHWLLNESPWAEAFLTKKVLYAKRYGVEMDTSKNGGLVYGATIACRIWEWPAVIVAWSALHNQGVGKNFAFLLGHYITVGSSGKALLNEFPKQDNHTAIQPSYIADYSGYLARFAKGEFLIDHSPEQAFYLKNKDDIQRYYANEQFLKGNRGTTTVFKTALKALAQESEEKGENKLNPFARNPVSKSYDIVGLSKKLIEFESRLEVK